MAHGNVSYDSKSPYANTPFVDFYLGLYVDRPIRPDPSDILIEVEDKFRHRPDLLSFDLYGTTKYWWVFVRRNINKMRDPIFDLQPKLEIWVPTAERLQNLGS